MEKNKMQPTNPNSHMYVNGTDVETHGYAVTQNTFLQIRPHRFGGEGVLIGGQQKH